MEAWSELLEVENKIKWNLRRLKNMKMEGIKRGIKKEREGQLWHARCECRVIKMTSDGGTTITVSSCRWAHNEDGGQGLWLRTKSREAKDEVQQENQFSPPSSPLPLRERFTGQVMTAHNNGSHISLLQSDNGNPQPIKSSTEQSCYLLHVCVCVLEVLKNACHR